MTNLISNLEVLNVIDPNLADEMINFVPSSNIKIEECKDKNKTIKQTFIDENKRLVSFYIHSRYNPVEEAAQFADIHEVSKLKHVILYGFGLGYHVKEILNQAEKDIILWVLDLSLEHFYYAIQLNDLSDILKDNRLRVCITSNVTEIALKLDEFLEKKYKLIIYGPSIKGIINNDVFKLSMESFITKANSINKYKEITSRNYLINSMRKEQNIASLFGKYSGIPGFVVSAGPSLNKNKKLLYGLSNKYMIISVGSALKALLDDNITPTMLCIIDPTDLTYNQIEGVENIDVPLIYLDTASSYTVQSFNGPKYVATNCSEHATNPREVIMTGGSVATAVMDILIRMGCNPIVFVGQDLAYDNGNHHAIGNMYGEDEQIEPTKNMRQQTGQTGELLYTNLGLLSFKKWIEDRIGQCPHIRFINATEGGLFIEGCEHMNLKDCLEALEKI